MTTASNRSARAAPAEAQKGARVLGDDAELTAAVRAAQGGDETAFRTVYRAVHPRLLGYVRTLVGEPDAEDVTSEAWLQIARDLERFSGDADRFRGWAARIARNRALDHIRMRGRRPAIGGDETELTGRPAESDTAGEAIEALATDGAFDLISRLPQDQAEAVVLRVVVGLDAKTAAQTLGKRPGAVRTAAHRGLRLAPTRRTARRRSGRPSGIRGCARRPSTPERTTPSYGDVRECDAVASADAEGLVMADERYRWLDAEAAERLLSGESPQAAGPPAGDQAERLAGVLRALSAPPPTDEGELPGRRPRWPPSASRGTNGQGRPTRPRTPVTAPAPGCRRRPDPSRRPAPRPYRNARRSPPAASRPDGAGRRAGRRHGTAAPPCWPGPGCCPRRSTTPAPARRAPPRPRTPAPADLPARAERLPGPSRGRHRRRGRDGAQGGEDPGRTPTGSLPGDGRTAHGARWKLVVSACRSWHQGRPVDGEHRRALHEAGLAAPPTSPPTATTSPPRQE